MGSKPDYIRKKYGPLMDKTLRNVLAHRIHKEFPRIGGHRMQTLCADLILEVLAEHLRPRDHFTHGQVLWLAVSVNDPPRRHQRIADTDLVPVVLEISTADDIERRIARSSRPEYILEKALRLCEQAHSQGGLLSNCDLSEMIGVSDSSIASILANYERSEGKIIPRRATTHDVGTGLTHKRIICKKRYLEGKEPSAIARETYHTIEAVDRYLAQYDRVRLCRREGMTPSETAYALNCSVALVIEYINIDDELISANG
jgi:hypothetical protein